MGNRRQQVHAAGRRVHILSHRLAGARDDQRNANQWIVDQFRYMPQLTALKHFPVIGSDNDIAIFRQT